MRKGIALLFSLLLPSFIYSNNISGKVISVIDGDTIDVLVYDQTYRVRLSKIDAPEKKQSYGAISRKKLYDLCFYKNVKIIIEGYDRYNRIIGTVFIKNNNINIEMINSGLAWVYIKYCKDKIYYEAEKLARHEQRGLWKEINPISPWEFRKKKKWK